MPGGVIGDSEGSSACVTGEEGECILWPASSVPPAFTLINTTDKVLNESLCC